MVKIFLTELIILMFSINCYCQIGWFSQNSLVNTNLQSIKFISHNTGICVGDQGIILRTTNGGSNWIQQPIVYENNLRSLAIVLPNTAFIVGDSGLTLKSTDMGLSWIRLNLIKPNYRFTTISISNDSVGYVSGSNYNFSLSNRIFKSTNGGNTWDSLLIFSGEYEFIRTIFFINPLLGWITGGDHLLISEFAANSTNGGINWNHQIEGQPPFNTIFFLDSISGWLSGRSSVSVPTIFRTTNGGINWETVFPGTGATINSLYFISHNSGWAAGDDRTIQATSNGGIDWYRQTTSQSGLKYNSVYFADSLTGWVVGDSGRILKTTTGGVLTNFSNTSSEIPDKYFLSQNYPNPFNPVSNLEFGISEFPKGQVGFVTLKIYDILGNEVATLVNEYKPAGVYKVEWNASDFPSGVYLYKLWISSPSGEVDGNLIDTKRMILLK